MAIFGTRDFRYLPSRRHGGVTSRDDVTGMMCSWCLGEEHEEEEQQQQYGAVNPTEALQSACIVSAVDWFYMFSLVGLRRARLLRGWVTVGG